MDETQRRNWLRTTLADIAVSGLRREAGFRGRPPGVNARHRRGPRDPRTPAGASEQAFSSLALERSWQVIQGMPEPQHTVALLRWQLDMKEAEIAQVLGIAEKTVSAHLDRARRRLIAQLGQGEIP
jgi:RNA polymerase sigma factor (sigma-70 family)